MEDQSTRLNLSITPTMEAAVIRLAAKLTKESGIKHNVQDAIRWAIASATKKGKA